MTRAKAPRHVRINRIARKLAARYTRQRFTLHKGGKKPFYRVEREPKPKRLIAYDLETTPIAEGTPQPLYITAYASDGTLSLPLTDVRQLLDVLQSRLLIPDYAGCRFVAWNGNNFDVFFIARALLLDDRYLIRPYLTRGKSLRGLKVFDNTGVMVKGKKKILSWEFLDGLSMTGLGSTPLRTLKKFLDVYAPDFAKLDGPKFDQGESFDPSNAEHRLYAERDSEGLYHGIHAVQEIALEHFGVGLQPTIGNMGIKIFQAHMPDDVTVWEPGYQALLAIRDQVMRGGFCFCVRRYAGPIWKYDINQAYAAAMRETDLPAGSCIHARKIHPWARTGIYRIRATNPRNTVVPFYYTNMEKEKCFAFTEITETWLTTIEIEQLKRERWNIEVLEGYFWDDHFRMTEYVDRLESLRMNAPGGPNGAQGLIMKCIGNNSYGKTVEVLDGIELVLSSECPEGFYEYQDATLDDEGAPDLSACLWFRFNKPVLREYHQPHIGAFITAYVRMVVRRAALANSASWIYADTDCVVLTAPPVPGSIPLNASQYGYWKEEENGANYYMIGKKVYASQDGKTKHAKGMNVKHLELNDFQEWYLGRSPKQTQVQRQNFVKVMTGSDMFRERTKVGEKKIDKAGDFR